ncbi:MAG: carbohydrate ABC transporter permease [Christensenellales bacterium]
MNKRSPLEVLFDTFNVFSLLLLSLVCLYPLLYVLFASLSNANLMLQHRGILLAPLEPNIEAYIMVFKNPMILKGYTNTLVYVTLGTSVNLIMTILCAYVLSRSYFTLKKAFNFIIIFTMFFSGGLIPSYLLVQNLGLVDKTWALILPYAINTYNMIIMRTSFSDVPASLEESARLDGANDMQILMRIIIPLSMPVIAIIILFYGVSHWNSWFSAMIYLRSRSKFPLQLILREILIASSTTAMTADVANIDKEPVEAVVKYATIIVATLPILLLYPFMQRYFVQGVMIGAIKG